MAVLEQGIFGLVSGRIGSRVYYVRKGKQMVRELPNPALPKKAPSDAQIKQREKFRVLQKFLKPFSPVLKTGFKNYARQTCPKLKAFSVNYPKIYASEAAELVLDLTKLELSEDYGPALSNLQMEDKGDGLFGLSWEKPKDIMNRNNTLALVLYDETQHEVNYTFALAPVSQLQAEFHLHNLIGRRVHVFVFTVGPKLVRKSPNSVTQYLGMVF
ncbi:DUF6266 family protein [Pedobacter gandavensis]|uniref:DUF6266 family protein n=1 Tax=Pedobacter gandavensis TaxID=2679963 RepID=UPI0029316BB2|nr:DUF6266 family protein [Pedobacter gandavensis]